MSMKEVPMITNYIKLFVIFLFQMAMQYDQTTASDEGVVSTNF